MGTETVARTSDGRSFDEIMQQCFDETVLGNVYFF